MSPADVTSEAGRKVRKAEGLQAVGSPSLQGQDRGLFGEAWINLQREFAHNNPRIERSDSSVWLSRAWDTWDSLGEISFTAVTPPRRRGGTEGWVRGEKAMQTGKGHRGTDGYVPDGCQP